MRSTDPDWLELRKDALQEYCMALLQLQATLNTEAVRLLFEIDDHLPEMALTTPEQTMEEHLCFSATVCAPCPAGVFIAINDYSLLGRVDAWWSNLWKNGSKAPLSSLVFHRQFRETAWSLPFEQTIEALSWGQETQTVAVGLGNGSVAVLKMVDNCTKVQKVFNAQAHSNSVTGVILIENNLYSTCQDANFRVTNIATGEELFALALPSHVASLTMLDKSSLVLACKSFDVIIIDIAGERPKVAARTHLDTATSPLQDSMSPSKAGIVMLLSELGEIQVLSAANLVQIDQIANELYVTAIGWRKESRELLLGTRDGRVTVYDLSTNEFVFIWKAHAAQITICEFVDKWNLLLTASEDQVYKVWQFPDYFSRYQVEETKQNVDETYLSIC